MASYLLIKILQDCAHLAQFMIDDDVDGRSFMLLNFTTAQVQN